MDQTTHSLLADYVTNESDAAFGELVDRYVDLVHSVALRMAHGNVHLAEDITQTVFADLARSARKLPSDVMLGGWLHRHTCFVASNFLRAERRRIDRENRSFEMQPAHDPAEDNLTEVAPVLDEAINQLGAEDRQAILLRFFEQRDFRAVGEALGSTEEAARKRVHRALQKLHLLLTRRGAVFSIGALGTVLSAHAVSAAPAGLAGTIAASALTTASTATSGVTLGFFQIMNTKLKMTLVAGALAVVASVPVTMQQRALSTARTENAALRERLDRLEELEAENARLTATLAEREQETAVANATDEVSREVLQLRGKISSLQTAAATPKPSALSGLTSNPEMMKMIRDQQKNALGSVYKDLVKELALPKEQADKLTDLLADNVMTNIAHISSVLSSGAGPAEMESLFAGQENAFHEALRGLLGENGFAEYKEFTRDILSSITTKQFKGMLSGDGPARDAKAEQLIGLLRHEVQQTLARAGLSQDYQLLPTLNFRNFASDEELERNLKLLNEVYGNVGSQAASFLNEEELRKWEEYREKALSSSRTIVAMNRKLMSPQTP